MKGNLLIQQKLILGDFFLRIFWQIPSEEIEKSELALVPKSIGSVQDVRQNILSIPKTYLVTENVILWPIDQGVMLSYREEFEADKVFSIEASSKVVEKTFFRLYVQLHERFDVILLDSGKFIGLKAFKERI